MTRKGAVSVGVVEVVVLVEVEVLVLEVDVLVELDVEVLEDVEDVDEEVDDVVLLEVEVVVLEVVAPDVEVDEDVLLLVVLEEVDVEVDDDVLDDVEVELLLLVVVTATHMSIPGVVSHRPEQHWLSALHAAPVGSHDVVLVVDVVVTVVVGHGAANASDATSRRRNPLTVPPARAGTAWRAGPAMRSPG